MDILAGQETLRIVLKCFADKLWEKMKNENGESIVKFKDIYMNSVIDMLGLERERELKVIEEPNEEVKNNSFIVKEKPRIPLPFYGVIEENWCFGIKKNHGLYTQCPKKKMEDEMYCRVCYKQCIKNVTNKPNCGDIRDRANSWTEELKYKPRGMATEKPYIVIMDKLDIAIEDANQEAARLGWKEIPECHLKEHKKIKNRKIKKSKVCVWDSD
jgi:hypothetical protein